MGGSLSYNPSNQGLKPQKVSKQRQGKIVFILQSIKPRVETCDSSCQALDWCRSLSYNPSNQGLKLKDKKGSKLLHPRLYPTIHQTKGWNNSSWRKHQKRVLSLSYNPSNQGLKLCLSPPGAFALAVFILQSIKPRVETSLVTTHLTPDMSLYPTIHQTKGWNPAAWWACTGSIPSLSYNPSNQGLKLFSPLSQYGKNCVFILQSIKPRVETSRRSC